MEILIGSLLTLQLVIAFRIDPPRFVLAQWFFSRITRAQVSRPVDESVRRDQAFIEIICNAPVDQDCMKDNPFSREQ